MKREWVVGLGVLVREGRFEDEAEDVILKDFKGFLMLIRHTFEKHRIQTARVRFWRWKL